MILITFLVSLICASYVRAGVNVGLSHNLNLCLDAQLSPRWQMQNGLHVQGWQCSDSDNQQITLRNDRSVAFGREQRFCMDVKDGVFAPGTSVIYWDCYSGSPNQIWNYLGSGVFQSASHPEFCLDVTDGRFVNGVFMQLYYCNEQNPNQVFSVGGRIGSSSAVSGGNSGGGASSSGYDKNSQLPKWAVDLYPTRRMVSWAYDDRVAPKLNGPLISCYNHWEDPIVQQMDKRIKFIPMYHSDKKLWQWEQQQMNFNGQIPPFILSINEPDVQSQANMNPYEAAQRHKEMLSDIYGNRGSKLCSPAYAWNIQDLKTFMQHSKNIGSRVDAIGIHIYVDINKGNAFEEVKRRVNEVWDLFKLPIVLSELGTTSSGGGSEWDHINLFKQCANFLDNHPGVMLWSWNGCFVRGIAHDSYMNDGGLAFFDAPEDQKAKQRENRGGIDPSTVWLTEIGNMFINNWY